MSYGLPEQPRRRGGIGKLIFPAILFFGALMFFRSMSAPRPNEQSMPQDRVGQTEDDEYRIKEDLFDSKGESDKYRIKEGLFDSTGKPMPSRQNQGAVNSASDDNWSMEEVDGNGSAQSPKSNKTQKGQWSIEEVDGEATKEKPQFRFSEQ